MIISLISVLTINHVIGRENVIPWFFSVDIDWFKYHTLNKPVIMGRKTFESIEKKPLPSRLNIVLSTQLLLTNTSNVMIVRNPIHAISLVRESEEIMIIGGSVVYKIFFVHCTRMYLTYIYSFYNYGDTWFPQYNKNEWRSVLDIWVLHKTRDKQYYNLNFKILERS